MAFDGNGNWISNFSAVADRNADIKILASRFDNIFIADLAESFENCLTKDMQVKPEQNFDANNNRIINVSNPVGDNDAINLSTLNTRIAAIEQDPILAFKWSDYEINDQSWLRADTFSWNDGTVYTNAYTHLYNDIQDITSSTETIGSYTITYYLAEDGHKIVMPDQEETIQNIYTESGVAWYYILDTTNQRFKLPRTKYGFTGYRNTVGKYVPESLPNISTNGITDLYVLYYASGAYSAGAITTTDGSAGSSSGSSKHVRKFGFDASLSSSSYQDDAPVQQRATQMYLYFYVGQFTQTATQQTAGLNSSLFNGKADVDLSNAVSNASSSAKETIVGWGLPDYTAVVTISAGSYTPPKDGLIRVSGGNNNSGKKITVNGADAAGAWVASSTSTDITAWVQKGDAVEIIGGGVDVYFFPLKGV